MTNNILLNHDCVTLFTRFQARVHALLPVLSSACMYNKRSVLRRQSRDTNRNIKR